MTFNFNDKLPTILIQCFTEFLDHEIDNEEDMEWVNSLDDKNNPFIDNPDILHTGGFDLEREPEPFIENGEIDINDYEWLNHFNGNSKSHHIIMFAGEYEYETDTLRKRTKDEAYFASSDFIDFSDNKIVRGMNFYDASVGMIEDRCGKEDKGCFGYPSGCIKYANCDILAKYWKKRESGAGNDMELNVKLKVQRIMRIEN